MQPELMIYKVNDFIRRNESGEIDFERSISIVREVAEATSHHPGHNILIDLRKTTITFDGVDKLMKIALEFVHRVPFFKNKIANVIPREANRVFLAGILEACMKIKDVQYKYFTNFEEAINWLSDIKSE